MTATTATLFENLRQQTATLHQRTLDHPTVRGIGNGTLPEGTFRYYLEQDFQFLLRFARMLAIAASSAPDLETMAQLSRLVSSTVDVEIDALREIYGSFGGEPATLDAIDPAPVCEAYCNHLLAAAHERSPLVAFSAFLPCHWGYHDIGLHLQRRGLPSDGRYAAWIEEYASEQYGELVRWAIARFNELGSQAGYTDRRAASRAWELSSRYEYAFWEMAWTQERWPDAVTSG
jgi:thiaminase/transcriptional activator TenA